MELSLEAIVLFAVPVVFAITLHEAAHGYVAKMFGDRTAEMLGRVTLNPIKHVDLVGTILIPALLVLTKSPFLFGWAKPVPVDYGNLRNPRRDMLWVAAAGPAANFAMGLAWAFLFAASAPDGAWPSGGLNRMAEIGITVNLVLMALNLLPIPPLDGGRIAVSVLPRGTGALLARVEPFGMFILIALLVARVLDDLMRPLVRGGMYVIRAIVGF